MLQITDQNIEELLSSNSAVVIDFWADWCAPCRMIGPIVEELSKDNSDIIIGKLDIMENKRASARYNVTSIPTIIYFKDGKEIERTRGVLPKVKIQQVINSIKN